MAWKPKEKELSLEEALDQARRELAPHWLGSNPLFCGAQADEESEALSLIPLESSFSKDKWLIFFVDLMSFSGYSLLTYIEYINKHYDRLNLYFIVVIRIAYPFQTENKSISEFRKKLQLEYPWVIDHNGLVARTFGVSHFPSTILISEGNRIGEWKGSIWNGEFEQQLQNFLRSTDPGLPLQRTKSFSKEYLQDITHYRFGTFGETPMPAPGFKKLETGYEGGIFTIAKGQKPKLGEILLQGAWTRRDHFISTFETGALLSIGFTGTDINLAAQSVSKDLREGELHLEIDGQPVKPSYVGTDSKASDEGRAQCSITLPKLYSIVKDYPNKDNSLHTLTLRFKAIRDSGVGIFMINSASAR